MDRSCSKCGHVKADATGDASEACPACGAIYTRVEQLQARQRAEFKKVRLKRAVEEVRPHRWITPVAAKVAYGLMLAALASVVAIQAVSGTVSGYAVAVLLVYAVVGWIAVEAVLVLFVIADHLAAARQHLAVLRARAEEE